MGEVVVRPMRLKDVDAVAAIEAATFAHPWSRESFRQEKTRNAAARYLVAEEDGEIVGYAGAWVIIDESHITNIAVREALRPLELGRRYTLYGEPFRKLAVPEDVPEDLRALYRMKYFGAQSVPETADWEMLWSHAAAECVTAELERMGPVLRLMAQCRQERQLAQTAPEEQKKAPGLGRHRARSVEEFEF